ncbi:MAG TPA: aminotransferase class I/II-fold pyridoxal phosphate-dependent enzyme [Steroidobacteraceae bacterium]|nr:aminotransferase class I/II-fold pyridoxal phosphate-dependent enzyme [Steroidobacteraceae bacterium]
MKLPSFLLDRWLAAHEFSNPPILYNLASSAGPSLTLRELLTLCGESGDELQDIRLAYAPPEGHRTLRESIARFYDVDPEWVITTTGASEALLLLYARAAAPGASIALPAPLFPPMSAVAQAWGYQSNYYTLDRKEHFAHKAERIMAAVTGTTSLALINTPHNPTGAVMPTSEIERLAASLADRGIPLIVDEVYHPLYFGDSHSSAAKIPNVVVVGDFSKAFSLPGLRIGWIIDRDRERREQLIDLRSYFTLSGSPLCESLGILALRHIDLILDRLKLIAYKNLGALESFMHDHRDRFGWVPPHGGTVTFPWRLDGQSTRPMCEALAKAGVLFVPGDCFDMPEHFRVGFGHA